MNRESREGWMTGVQEWKNRLARALDVANENMEVFVAVIDLEDRRPAANRGIDAHIKAVRDTIRQWFTHLEPGDVLTWYLSGRVALCFSRRTAVEAVELIQQLRALTIDYLPFRAGMAVWNGFESSGVLLARAEFELLQGMEQDVEGPRMGPWLESRLKPMGK